MVLLLIREQGTSNVIGKPALRTCLLLGAAMTAMGCSGLENPSKCRSVDPDTRIAGCTALVQSGLIKTGNLSTIYNNRGTAYSSKGDHDRAIQDFNEAIQLNPNFERAYYDRGNAYIDKEEYDRAIQDFNEAVQLNPNAETAYYGRGYAYKKKGDYDRAIQDFNEAIQLNPNFERAYYDRGNAYIDREEYDRAIQDFNEAIQLNPNNANNYNNRGVAYKRKGDYGRAIQDYSQAIHLNSNDTTAYLNRGDAYFAQSNPTAAIADFEHTISAAPSSSAAVSAALLLHVVMKRQGHDDMQQLARVAAAADLSKWPGAALKLDLGQVTANDVMVAAASGVSYWQKWRVCEANYFTGEDALFHHQRTKALARFTAARDACPKGDTGYTEALAELKRLRAPGSPNDEQ
jgi:tetratricopeptide (TPR) repeat protein